MRFRFLLGLLGLVCSGCPSPNTFTVPRTVPVGRVQHTIAVEAIGVAGGDDAVYLPVPPSYTARIGAADRFDVGIHLSHMSSLGLDLKWNPVRTPGFDLAIDPGAQGFYIAGGGESVFIWYLHAPLLLGINPSPTATILFTPGISVIGASAESDNTFSGSSSASDSIKLLREAVFLTRFIDHTNIRLEPGYGVSSPHLSDFGSDGQLLQVGFDHAGLKTNQRGIPLAADPPTVLADLFNGLDTANRVF
jgi:hypothetical protein